MMDDNIVDRLREVIKQQGVSMANMRREFEETEKALHEARNTLAFKKMTIEYAVEVIRAEYNKLVEETAKLKDQLTGDTKPQGGGGGAGGYQEHVLTPVTPANYEEACDAFVRACDRGVRWKNYYGAAYNTRLNQAFQQIHQAYIQACITGGGSEYVKDKADQQA